LARQFRWSDAIRKWVGEHGEVRFLKMAEAGFMDGLQHPFAHALPRHAQQSAKEGRARLGAVIRSRALGY
jgi:hypothetical protein